MTLNARVTKCHILSRPVTSRDAPSSLCCSCPANSSSLRYLLPYFKQKLGLLNSVQRIMATTLDNSGSRTTYARAILGPTLHNRLPQTKVLLVGAGGIGCELCTLLIIYVLASYLQCQHYTVKNIVLVGFGHITLLDLDTIDLSNLNRQFLFRKKDVKQSKAMVRILFFYLSYVSDPARVFVGALVSFITWFIPLRPHRSRRRPRLHSIQTPTYIRFMGTSRTHNLT